MGYSFSYPHVHKFAKIVKGENDPVGIAVCLGVYMVLEALKQGSGVTHPELFELFRLVVRLFSLAETSFRYQVTVQNHTFCKSLQQVH